MLLITLQDSERGDSTEAGEVRLYTKEEEAGLVSSTGESRRYEETTATNEAPSTQLSSYGSESTQTWCCRWQQSCKSSWCQQLNFCHAGIKFKISIDSAKVIVSLLLSSLVILSIQNSCWLKFTKLRLSLWLILRSQVVGLLFSLNSFLYTLIEHIILYTDSRTDKHRHDETSGHRWRWGTGENQWSTTTW